MQCRDLKFFIQSLRNFYVKIGDFLSLLCFSMRQDKRLYTVMQNQILQLTILTDLSIYSNNY
ncbi:MAG: hypothetical protein A3F18_01280 [Legionellales bacterium RIFCSPHIGHO2_12_FULL_37_14]|nr:MAG: hypothetical protein A3F18_01280 [Legionellales bacterium RIFCSPHIGHO2_12_FULL_37_14]